MHLWMTISSVSSALQEIKEALIEERTDIMADPVLHEACSSSVTKHCDAVSHGRGRSKFFFNVFSNFITPHLPQFTLQYVVNKA